tara:strand:- start:488 stop:739 length:252 start_codon:yes stop_codon:yes gene_type:complete
MTDFNDLLEKVPKPIKDKFLIKKRERAIEIVKEKINTAGKTITDFNDEEMEGMIGDEEKNLKYDQLKAMLVTILTVEGLSHLI